MAEKAPVGRDFEGLLVRIGEQVSDVGNCLDAGLTDQGKHALEQLTRDVNLAQEQTRELISTAGSSSNGVPPPQLRAVPEPGPAIVSAQNVEAEEYVLGAILLSPNAVPAVRALVDPADFFSLKLGKIYAAALDLYDSGAGIDAVTLADYLGERGQLEEVGGRVRVHELGNLAGASPNAPQYARIIHRHALERNLRRAVEIEPRDPVAVEEAAAALTREQIAGPRRALDAADWLANAPEGCPAVWGSGERVLWAEGEPLMIYGPDGVGKTTLAQQVVLALCGIRHETLLDLPIPVAQKPVLYLACDRPRQIRRSFFRMIPREMHAELAGKLLIWEGPLPFQIPLQPRALLEFCLAHDAGHVIVDSLKDVAVELTKPEIALRVNQAFQWCVSSSVEALILHHPRKAPAGEQAKPKTLEDVYGDRNFVSGMGSVISLYGKAGDPIVALEHLKQPSGEVGPFKILHEHESGRTSLYEFKALGSIINDAPRPLTAVEVAGLFYAVAEPDKNQVEKARRELRKLAARGDILEGKDPHNGAIRFAKR